MELFEVAESLITSLIILRFARPVRDQVKQAASPLGTDGDRNLKNNKNENRCEGSRRLVSFHHSCPSRGLKLQQSGKAKSRYRGVIKRVEGPWIQINVGQPREKRSCVGCWVARYDGPKQTLLSNTFWKILQI